MAPLQSDPDLLARLAEESPTAIVVSTLAEGKILDVNGAFLRLFEYSRDDVIGKTSTELDMWADPLQRAALIASLRSGEPIRDFMAVVRTSTGSKRHILAAVAQVDINGRACLLTHLYDMTAYHQMETQFQALVEQIPVITYAHALDESQTLTYISPQVESVLGYSPAEVLAGQPEFLISRTHPEDQAHVREASAESRRTLQPLRVEYRVQTRDRRWVCLQDEAIVVRDEQGRPLLWQGVMADVTARRAAEDALRESEARFRALLQNSYDTIVVLDPDGSRTYVSPSSQRLLGYSPEELVGQSAMDLIHPDDVPRLTEAIDLCLRGAQQTPAFQVRFRHRNGTWRDFESVGTNALADPSIAGIVFNSRDVTLRTAAESALRESEARFRAVWETTSDAFALSDPNGIVLAVNPAYCSLYGFSEKELIGHTFSVIFPEESRPWAEEQYRAVFADPNSSGAYETLVRRRDGSERIVEARSSFISRDGDRIALVSTIRDVTERHAAAEALRLSEQHFRTAFAHAPIGMALIEPDGRFNLVNRSLCELVGYPEGELLDKSMHDLAYADDLPDAMELSERMWSAGLDTFQIEQRYQHKDGHIIWVLLTASAVREAGAPRYAIVQILDITDRRRLDMERAILLASEREYSRQLRSLAEIRADLTAMIAHELRAPVSALRMMTHLLAQGGLAATDEAEMFAGVNAEIDQLDRLISDVSAAATAEREGISVQLHAVPMSLLMEHATVFARTALTEHPFSLSEFPAASVWCDPERINQVLSNLLDNAAKHTPPGTVVALRARRDGDRVRFEVADRGPGIAADELGPIFEKFGRGRMAAARQIPGAGLGLYLSREIVRLHGSDITVVSMPDGETVFAFDLEAVE
jgi:PAS domain S-box-containing protein